METFHQILAALTDNRYAQAGLAVLASFVAAFLVHGLAGLGLRFWARRTRTQLDDDLFRILRRPLVTTVVLIGLGVATLRLDLGDPYAGNTLRVLKTVCLLVWTLFALRFCNVLLKVAGHEDSRFRMIEERTLPLFDNLTRLLILGGAAYVFIVIWEIDATGWIASAGIMGIAVGFAARDTLSNLFAGVFIIADAPYRIGDVIVLGSGERGRVVHIGLRSTRILTRDNVEITVPNSIMGNGMVTNETGGPQPRMRVRIQVDVAYGTDLDPVRAALLGVPEGVAGICGTPKPRVRFRAFGGSGLQFELLCWIQEPSLRGQVVDALNTAVYKRFAEEGIEIPYAKQDLYIKEMPSAGAPPGNPGS